MRRSGVMSWGSEPFRCVPGRQAWKECLGELHSLQRKGGVETVKLHQNSEQVVVVGLAEHCIVERHAPSEQAAAQQTATLANSMEQQRPLAVPLNKQRATSRHRRDHARGGGTDRVATPQEWHLGAGSVDSLRLGLD